MKTSTCISALTISMYLATSGFSRSATSMSADLDCLDRVTRTARAWSTSGARLMESFTTGMVSGITMV